MMQLLLLIFKKRYESFRAKKRLTPKMSGRKTEDEV
jgi:hypothetical protein